MFSISEEKPTRTYLPSRSGRRLLLRSLTEQQNLEETRWRRRRRRMRTSSDMSLVTARLTGRTWKTGAVSYFYR